MSGIQLGIKLIFLIIVRGVQENSFMQLIRLELRNAKFEIVLLVEFFFQNYLLGFFKALCKKNI